MVPMSFMDAFNLAAGLCSFIGLGISIVTLSKVINLNVKVGDRIQSDGGPAISKSGISQSANGINNRQSVS